MTLVQGYTRDVLMPQLRSLGLTKRQRAIVVEDVTQRLESLLSHWSDGPFRRTALVLGTEEASFWEPRSASLEIRSLVVVAVRNSLIEDLHASRAYTPALRSPTRLLPDEGMPWITGAATTYFQASTLDAVQVQPRKNLFGSLPGRFPNAWHALSLLGNSSETEIACQGPVAEAEPLDFSSSRGSTRSTMKHAETESGIDAGLNDFLVEFLKKVESREADLFFSSCFKGITRNPEKLLSIIDHVLRHGGMILTPNYLLSPTYLARRDPLLRPEHSTSELAAKRANRDGLSERHKAALASLEW